MLMTIPSLLLCGSLASAAGALQGVPLLRLVVVDVSASMHDPDGNSGTSRMDFVRQDLRKFAQQLPPSPTLPIALITFNDHAEAATLFTEAAAFDAAVGQLQPNGGTCIACGLAQAHASLDQFQNAQQVVVLLYTDGEDSDQAAIRKQEAKLNALFAVRHQRGLGQTVAFCKRWEGANAELAHRLAQSPDVRVVDPGELALHPVTFEPAVYVDDVQWLDDAHNVEITFRPEVTLRGDVPPQPVAPLQFRCLNAGAEGDVDVAVAAGGPATTQRLRLRVEDAAIQAAELVLEFSVQPPAVAVGDAAHVLPILTASQLLIPVSLPNRQIRNRITASLKLSAPPTWSDPASGLTRIPLALELDVTTVDKTAQDRSSRFELIWNSGVRLIEGDSAFQLPGLGHFDIPLMVEAPAADPAASIADLRFPVALTLNPIQVAPGLTYEPPTLTIELPDIAAPPAVETKISAMIRGLSDPRWEDVVLGTARFTADVEFAVDGPLAPQSRLTLVSAATIRTMDFAPRTLRSGRQRVRIDMLATLPAAPHRQQFTIGITPPPPFAGVIIGRPAPLQFSVLGPPPLRLLALQGGRPVARLVVQVADNDQSGLLALQPVLAPQISSQKAGQIMVTARGPDLIASKAGQCVPLELDANEQIPVSIPRSSSLPFFEDTLVDSHVSILPPSGTKAIVGSRYPIQYVIEAPFKRLLFLLAVTLSALVGCFAVLRLYVKLRASE